MLRFGIVSSVLLLASISGCGSDDSTPGGSGGSAGSTATGGSNSGGSTSTGGSAGSTATGGSNSGGSTSSGGAAGSTATGGAAGSSTGGSGGGSSVTFLNQGKCPDAAPTSGTTCGSAAMCCYEPGGTAFVCTPSIVGLDGGTPSNWKTVPNKTCCPATEPTLGASCAVPGVIGCCYGSNGYRCGGPQNPDQWVTATGC